MKQLVNFRLSEQSLNILAILENKLHHTKTAIVEDALQFYAKKEFAKQSQLLKYAGTLSKKDADVMLEAVNNKHNKDFEIEL